MGMKMRIRFSSTPALLAMPDSSALGTQTPKASYKESNDERTAPSSPSTGAVGEKKKACGYICIFWRRCYCLFSSLTPSLSEISSARSKPLPRPIPMILKQILQIRARRPSTRCRTSPGQAQIARATHAVPVHTAAATTTNGARDAATRVPDAALAAGRRRALVERVAARRRQAGRAGRRDTHAARALVPRARRAAQAEQRGRGAAAAYVRHLRPRGRLRGARGVVARGQVGRGAVGGAVEARAGGGGEEERGG